MGRQDYETETLIPVGGSFDVTHALKGEGHDASEDGTGLGVPVIPILEVGKGTTSRGDGPNGCGIGDEHDPMYTLQAGAQHAVAFATTQVTSKANRSNPKPGDPCHPLTGQGHAPAIAAPLSAANGATSNTGGREDDENLVAFHASQDPCVSGDVTHPCGRNGGRETAVAQKMRVRRLTPRECERLQGFPDDYTLVEYRGKPACDGPRYKALGNAMAVPVMFWIGQRIAMVDALNSTTTGGAR